MRRSTAPVEEASPAKGRKRLRSSTPLPTELKPQLATLATKPPTPYSEWIYEIKFDGYRVMTRFEEGHPVMFTRGGHDWTSKMPGLVSDLKKLGITCGWVDGEIVVLDSNGLPNFNALQNAFDRRRPAEITYFLFDAPFLNGSDLRTCPLEDRRRKLAELFEGVELNYVRFSSTFDADPMSILDSACRMKMEGIIAKRRDSPYVSTRTDTWLKLKCKQRQEFVVCGYTDRSDGARQVGSLLLGVHGTDGLLTYAGSVGTGWTAREAAALKARLVVAEIAEPPFVADGLKRSRWSRRRTGGERWVTPELVAEVEFAEWTPDGHVRHASYLGLREDKSAAEVVRE